MEKVSEKINKKGVAGSPATPRAYYNQIHETVFLLQFKGELFDLQTGKALSSLSFLQNFTSNDQKSRPLMHELRN